MENRRFASLNPSQMVKTNRWMNMFYYTTNILWRVLMSLFQVITSP